MATDIGTVAISSALPLLGVLIGTGATVIVQRNSVRESRIRSDLEVRQTRRAEIKGAISSYLEAAQHLQTQLYAREHGREALDVPLMVEQIWLAQAQVDVICSERLRGPLVRHATVLNEVARHEERYPDWWAVVLPYKAALLDALREELRWPEAEARLLTPDSAEPAAVLDSYITWLSEFEAASERDGTARA